jgi:hypothetical protein
MENTKLFPFTPHPPMSVHRCSGGVSPIDEPKKTSLDEVFLTANSVERGLPKLR